MKHIKTIQIIGISYLIIFWGIATLLLQQSSSILILSPILLLLVVQAFGIPILSHKSTKIAAYLFTLLGIFMSYFTAIAPILQISLMLGILLICYLHTFDFLHHAYLKLGFECLGAILIMVLTYMVIVSTNFVLEPLLVCGILWLVLHRIWFTKLPIEQENLVTLNVALILLFGTLFLIFNFYFSIVLEHTHIEHEKRRHFIQEQQLNLSTIKNKNDVLAIEKEMIIDTDTTLHTILLPLNNIILDGSRQQFAQLQHHYKNAVLTAYRNCANATLAKQKIQVELELLSKKEMELYTNTKQTIYLYIVSYSLLHIFCYFISYRAFFKKNSFQ